MSGIIMNPMYELLKQRRWEKRQKKYEQMRAEAKGTGREEEVEKEIRKKEIWDSLSGNHIVF